MKLIIKNIEKKFNKNVVLGGASYEFESGRIYMDFLAGMEQERLLCLI